MHIVSELKQDIVNGIEHTLPSATKSCRLKSPSILTATNVANAAANARTSFISGMRKVLGESNPEEVN